MQNQQPSGMPLPPAREVDIRQIHPDELRQILHQAITPEVLAALVHELAQKPHYNNWWLMEGIYTAARRNLMSNEDAWRMSPGRILNVGNQLWEFLEPYCNFKDKVILDFGCGLHFPYGVLTYFYINGAAGGVGIDIEPDDQVRSAEAMYDILADALARPKLWHKDKVSYEEFLARIRRFDLNALRNGDIVRGTRDIPFTHMVENIDTPGSLGDLKFDLIISRSVLEHCTDLKGCLEEMHRATTPGGFACHIIDMTDHRAYDSDIHQWYFLTKQDITGDGGVCNRLRASEILKIFDDVGYSLSFNLPEKKPLPENLRTNLKPECAHFDDEDLATTSLHMVVKKLG